MIAVRKSYQHIRRLFLSTNTILCSCYGSVVAIIIDFVSWSSYFIEYVCWLHINHHSGKFCARVSHCVSTALQTRRLLATHAFLLGMVSTQMMVIFFISGPMSYIYVSYTNVVLIAGLILGPTSAALYTALILGLMFLYFSAIRTEQLDMLLLSEYPYGAEMEMIATQACFVFTGLTVSYFIVRQSRLHNQMVKAFALSRPYWTYNKLKPATPFKRNKMLPLDGWDSSLFKQSTQAFFETTLPKVFDHLNRSSLDYMPINRQYSVETQYGK